MDRTDTSDRATIRTKGPKLGLIVTTALASAALAGCTTTGAPPATTSFSKAQVALEKGDTAKAITHAEAAVLAEPRNGAYRAMLGAAYLEEGRFESAATSFGDALRLGHSDPRTVLSYALTKVATGDSKTALAALTEWENAIPADDLGLAYAIAGKPERGVHVLTNAVRAGLTTAKARQNLAYTYALAGNWRAARVMAAEDVPADQLDARLSEWAASARPEDYRNRVATLLRVTPAADSGLPAHLALSNFPSQEEMVAEAALAAEPAPQLAREQSAKPQAPVKEVVPAKEKAATSKVALAAADAPDEKVETIDPTPARSAPVKLAAAQPQAETPAKPVPRVSGKMSAAAVDAIEQADTAPEAGTVDTEKPAKAKPSSAKPETADARRGEAGVPAGAAPRVQEPAKRTAVASAPRFVSNPVVQAVPTSDAAPRRVATNSSQARMAATDAASKPAKPATAVTATADTHLVQLGSWDSHELAKDGWAKLKWKYPQLAQHDVVITEALVDGKTYFRVAAAGFGLSDARSMCRTVKSGGGGCFAYAKTNPPAGAVDRGVRIAARTD